MLGNLSLNILYPDRNSKFVPPDISQERYPYVSLLGIEAGSTCISLHPNIKR